MAPPQAVRRQAFDIVLDSEGYMLLEHKIERGTVPTQPADNGEPWEKRIENWGLGWGATRYRQPGTYDYGAPASLHRQGVFLPGAAVTALSPATAPTGNVSFGEYWDGTAANRRLIVVAARHVYEVDSAGTITVNTLTAAVPSTARMGKPVRFKIPAMSVPKVFIPVQNGAATDGFIIRSAANTYAEQASPLVARAMCAGKDIDGQDVMFRVDGNGRINLTTYNADPTTTGSWAGATYDAGETSARVNDLFQQNRAIIVGREDGAFTFDGRLNVIPLTKGMDQTPDADNFTYIKDANGVAIAPTSQGIIWIDGLEWGVCGPVSANPDAANLRGLEYAVSAQAGNYVYASVYVGSDSHIFMGTPSKQGDLGEGPFTWHGPVAIVTGFQVKDLFVSTVFGTKLWWGAVAKFGYIALNASDFAPATDMPAGSIYLPEGILDMDGPGIIKDFRKVEFVTRAGAPFATTNAWTFELETTVASGTYVAVNGGVTAAGDGVLAQRFWTTETSGKRLRARISYSGNTGAAELEAVIVRGTQRPEVTDEYTFSVDIEAGLRNWQGVAQQKSPQTLEALLFALPNAGRKVVAAWGDTSVTGYVTGVKEQIVATGELSPPKRYLNVTFRKAVTA
jgi:hypothetical protein